MPERCCKGVNKVMAGVESSCSSLVDVSSICSVSIFSTRGTNTLCGHEVNEMAVLSGWGSGVPP